jgi:hypothetical protein
LLNVLGDADDRTKDERWLHFAEARMWKKCCAVLVAVIASGCRYTSPGTHVELVDQGGQKVYVAGAAYEGISKTAACQGAVGRAVSAIALRFSQEHEGLADEIAKSVGADDGNVFLQRFAKADAENGAVQDVSFDPMEHLCMATVRWRPPIFVKQAVHEYAERIKQAELKTIQGSPSTAPTGNGGATSAIATPTAPPPPPPAAQSVAPSKPAAPKPQCVAEREKLDAVRRAGQKTIDDFNECMRRSNNENTCYRYKLYVEESDKKRGDGAAVLVRCLNRNLPTSVQLALAAQLPGHAGITVENRDDGTVIVWTLSPNDQTAFALEIDGAGKAVGQTALAANQAQWVREQFGL